MLWLRQLVIDVRQRLLYLFRRDRLDSDLEEEIRFHLEMREEREVAKGGTAAEATHRARRRLGIHLSSGRSHAKCGASEPLKL